MYNLMNWLSGLGIAALVALLVFAWMEKRKREKAEPFSDTEGDAYVNDMEKEEQAELAEPFTPPLPQAVITLVEGKGVPIEPFPEPSAFGESTITEAKILPMPVSDHFEEVEVFPFPEVSEPEPQPVAIGGPDPFPETPEVSPAATLEIETLKAQIEEYENLLLAFYEGEL